MNELRVPRTADAKHSEKAVKCRKVQVNEIAAIGDLLKYRFIGYHKSIDEVRQLFNSVGNEADAGSRESSEYISMREVIGVLKEHPFLLKEESAFLLARYIVEDCSNEHVYCD